MIRQLRERIAAPLARLLPDRTASERAVVLLRAGVLALAAGLTAWPLTVEVGVLAAALGAVAGVFGGELLVRTRLRTGALVVGAVLTGLLGLGVSLIPVDSSWIARALGPVPAFELGEVAVWFIVPASLLLALRFAAQRRPLLGLLEVLLAGGSIAASFAAHRQGMVMRPLAIGDWAWSRGIDPAMVLIALGGLGAVLLAALMVSESQRRRLPLHLGVLLILGCVLFALIRVGGLPAPRIPEVLGGEERAQDQARRNEGGGKPTQQNDEMDFRNQEGFSGESAPVAVAILHDDYAPPAGVFYFRQSAASQYNGQRLVQSTRDDVDRDIARQFPSAPTPVAEVPAAGFGRRDLRITVGLLVDHPRPFALDSPRLFAPVPNPNPMRFRRAFEAISSVPTLPYEELLYHRAGSPDWSPAQWAHYTEHPPDPRYEKLAREITSRLKGSYREDPLAKALAIKYYLDENGIYSTRNKHAGNDDPAASFLFGDLTGYCIHFAHAAVYMFRSLDIPARVALGYAIPEADRGVGSALMIRGGNAHAWPEIYLDGVGWTVVDPAPQQTLDPMMPKPDQTLQSMLGEMMRQQPGKPDEFAEQQRILPTLAELLRALALMALAAATAGLTVKVYRRSLPAFAPSEALYRVGYRAAMDRLADVGMRRRHGESREHFAARVHEVAPSFQAFTEQHLRWALGSRRTEAPEALRRLSRELGADLGRGIPIWRRALGWANPFSWIGVR